MTTKEYLQSVLKSQTIDDDSEEMKALDKHQKKVTQLIEKALPKSSPTIELGGSGAKGTRNKESYDLDIICYFPHEDSEPGDSLKELYASVKGALEAEYLVESKRSSLRLKGKSGTDTMRDFHIDVVPGRYVDDTETDSYLHQQGGEKKWLKTNLRTHIRHVKNSGFVDAIRLIKLWTARNAVNVKTFVLELAVIKLLDDMKGRSLEAQLVHVFESFKDDIKPLSVEDPANSNNDLKPILDEARLHLQVVASSSLETIKSHGWEAVFGKVEDKDAPPKAPAVISAAGSVSNPTRPWSPEM